MTGNACMVRSPCRKCHSEFVAQREDFSQWCPWCELKPGKYRCIVSGEKCENVYEYDGKTVRASQHGCWGKMTPRELSELWGANLVEPL